LGKLGKSGAALAIGGANRAVGRYLLMPKSPKPARIGTGALSVARETCSVEFAIHLVNAVNGARGGKGAMTGAPEAMRQAFREGRARLTLDDGVDLEVMVVAHTEGSETAYFQVA
jgi:hypothetical protein